MPNAEIARRSGLSAQTVSNIVRALEAEGLLERRKAVRGKVGKPSVPVALNPLGVYSLGLSIGRRSAELGLFDFEGYPLESLMTTYAYPTIEGVFEFLIGGIERILKKYSHAPDRIAGLGVAYPNQIWKWLELVDAPESAMQRWQDLDLGRAIEEATGFEVFTENDATSACVAEHLLGLGSQFNDFAYIFVGAFVGGGLVLNGKVVSGPTHYAAALGPLPVPDGKRGTTQLLNVASLLGLERAMEQAGHDPKALRLDDAAWTAHEILVAPWIEKTARNLAIAVAAVASVVEIEAMLIDGAMPEPVRKRLTEAVRDQFGRLELTGLREPKILEAMVGRTARSVGAGLLPIHARYFLA